MKDEEGNNMKYDSKDYKTICTQTFKPGVHDTKFENLINGDYRYRLYLDDLPSKTMYEVFD